MLRHCDECNHDTEHDHEECISNGVKTTVDVCKVCGNADVDHDPIDDERYFGDDDTFEYDDYFESEEWESYEKA